MPGFSKHAHFALNLLSEYPLACIDQPLAKIVLDDVLSDATWYTGAKVPVRGKNTGIVPVRFCVPVPSTNLDHRTLRDG